MKKWLIDIIITIVMIVSVFFTLPTQASANINIGGELSNQYVGNGELSIITTKVYNADSDFIFSAGIITGLTTAGKTRTSLYIPAKIGGMNVTSIGSSAFDDCTSLTTVTIPSSVTSIGYNAFYNCISLTTVTIPNSVTNIGSNAFSNCISLTSVAIPSSLRSMGYSAFYGCESLTTVTIASGATIISSNAFSGCVKLTTITIPGSVTSIEYEAFSGCTNLATVTILSGVTSIGYNTFYNCRSLTTVTIPSSVTSIGSYAFGSCISLTKIYTPVSPIPSYTYTNRASIFEIIPTKYYNNMQIQIQIPTTVVVNKPQTSTKLSDNISIKSDKSEEKDGVITYTGNIAINEFLKLNGKLEKDTRNLTLKGEGQLYLETSSADFHGVINIYKGTFNFKADGTEILKATGADMIKIANLEFSISKLQLVAGGVRLGGSLKLPENIGGGGVTVETLEIVGGKIGFPSGKLELPAVKLGKSAIGLSDAYISYDAETNYFKGAGTLNIPKLFAISTTVGIENAKLEKVGLGISGINVAIDASGIFLNSIYGEVEGLASPPLVVKVKMDISGGPQIAGISAIKGKDLTIKVDMSGILSGSGELQLVSIPLTNANFKIEAGKGFQAGASFSAADIITGNCNLKVYYKPTLTIQGDSQVSLNIPIIGKVANTTGYFNNEEIRCGVDLSFAKGVAWIKYDGKWGFDFNVDLQQMPYRSLMAANAFVITSEMDKALVKIIYTDGAGDVVLLAPDGTRITPENSTMDSKVSNYLKLGNQKTIYYLLNNPQIGQWQYELINSTFTGVQVQTGNIKSDPVLNFVSSQSGDIAITVGNTSVNIPIQWQCSQTDGTIDILYSTKQNDELGIPLVTGLDVKSGGYTWSVDNTIPTGKYYITAVFRSKGIVPVFAYYDKAVIVTNLTTPIPPSNVSATSSNGNINVSWKPNTSPDIKGYVIAVGDGTNEKVFNVGLYDNFQVTGLENEKNYSIQLTSINNVDLKSGKSLAVNIYLPKPAPPFLKVDWSSDQYLNNGLLNVKGITEVNATVKVFVNDLLAQENLKSSFDSAVVLTEGQNEIRVVATKSNGDFTEKINTYWYDSNNPQLSVNDIYDGMKLDSLHYVVSGKVEPNAELLINGEKATEINGKFSYTLSLFLGINKVTISATDVAGNKTEFIGTITVNALNVDVNGDNVIDMKDLKKISENYNLKSSDSGWNDLLDLNRDGVIDIYDLIMVSKKIQ